MKMIHSCMVTKSAASQRRDGAAQHEVVNCFFEKCAVEIQLTI